MKGKILAILAVGLLTSSVAANATPITWYLQNIAFSDGGVANGSFVFDASTGIYSNINITTSGGNYGATFGTPNPSSPGSASVLIAVAAFSPLPADLTGVSELALNFSTPLTDLGGTVNVLPRPPGFSFEGVCSGATCTGVGVLRNVITGQVTTRSVPEPSTLALLGLGLAGLGFSRRRKSS